MDLLQGSQLRLYVWHPNKEGCLFFWKGEQAGKKLLWYYWAALIDATMSPLYLNFNWLPMAFRIYFNILLLTFKAPDCLAPSYFSDVWPRVMIWASVLSLLQAFAVRALWWWNSVIILGWPTLYILLICLKPYFLLDYPSVIVFYF